mmetsp:Transcript_14946/g.37622  ORF Transcript_14946/g.37622 Transcript_14946/m.37622 type:complete len:212 (-) Transcript_14946:390-1025(-)
MTINFMPGMCSSSLFVTRTASSLRSSPVSTMKGRNLSLQALNTSAAATLESTPPLTAPMTYFLVPSLLKIESTCTCAKSCMFQLPSQPQRSTTKLRMSLPPQGVCVTSGWNCTPHIFRASFPAAAYSQLSVCAMVLKPAGTRVTLSPWLIHTCTVASMSLNRGLPPPHGFFAGDAPAAKPSLLTKSCALPNSRFTPGSTCPPSVWQISCKP